MINVPKMLRLIQDSKKPVKWLFFLQEKCYNLSMKKLIKFFLIIFTIILLLILYINYNDYKNINKLEKQIIKKTDVKKINYLNTYGNYYIVMDDDNLYIFDDKYIELLKIDKILIHKNNKKYDIIYDEVPMYMNDYYKDGKLYYVYYDIYSYKKIGEVSVGGYDG